MKKKLLCAICAALCFAAVLCGCSRVGQITPKDVLTDSAAIRVMSFNVSGWNYKNTKNLVPRVILEYSPDLLGVQECAYDFYKTLTREMPEYAFVGVGRNTGDLSKDCGEASAILYKKDKFTLVDSGTFWLSETPDTPSQGWDGDYIRICTWVILKNNATGQEFAHVNTHLENIDDGTGMEALKNGTQMVVDKAVSFDMPVILTGDLNFEKDTEYYAAVTAAGFRDTQSLAENTMEGPTCGQEHIDYIFVNDGIAGVSTYKIVTDSYDGKNPSDHYPIYADIQFS